MATKKTKFEKSETLKNLARAFANETMEGARYQFTAQLAMQQGFANLQNVLKSIAKNEMAHAKTYFNLIVANCETPQDNIEICAGYPFVGGNLMEQLNRHLKDEKNQGEDIYLQFAATAKKEGYPEIAAIFNYVAQVERQHFNELKIVVDKMKGGKLYKSAKSTTWICADCGYVGNGKQAWTLCPLCGIEQGHIQIDAPYLDRFNEKA